MEYGKKVGIYGGTFDPIHNGHINLALQMLEIHQLDEVWFCPAKINPHKQHIFSTSTAHRLRMLELALDDLPSFGILMNEVRREGLSYTVDTLRELIKTEKTYPFPDQIFLILGDDSVANFKSWKEPEEIVKLVPLLVGKRQCSHQENHQEFEPSILYEAIQKGLTSTKVMEISASAIRERVHQKKYIRHLVPSKVVDYIYENQLYLSL